MDGHGRRSPVMNWLIQAISENLGLKVTSLLIAMALFGLVRGAGNVQRSIEVSLLYRLPPPATGRVPLTDLPDKIRLTVRGSPSLVGSLRADEIGPVQIDLSDGRRASYYLDPSLFQLPAGVQVEQIQPSTLQLSWDTLVERSVPIRPDITGTPGPGLRLVGDVEVTPPTVQVTGPALYVESIGAVRTDTLDVTGLPEGRHERRVALVAPRHNVNVRYDLTNGVRLAFTIDREIVERRFERLAVTPIGTARVEVRPPLVTMVVRGAPAVVNALDPAQLVPTVEVGDGATLRGPARMPVGHAPLPEGVSLVSVEPTEVIVLPAH